MSAPRSPTTPPQEKNAFLRFFSETWESAVEFFTPAFPAEPAPPPNSSRELKAIQDIFAAPLPPRTPILIVRDASQHTSDDRASSTNRLYDLFAALCLMDLEKIGDPKVFQHLSIVISKYSKLQGIEREEKPSKVMKPWMALVISEHLHVPRNRLLKNLDILLQRPEVTEGGSAIQSFLVALQNISNVITTTIKTKYPEWFCSLDQIIQHCESIRAPTTETSPRSVQLGQVKPKDDWRLQWCSIVERAVLEEMSVSDAKASNEHIDQIGQKIQKLPFDLFEHFKTFIDNITTFSGSEPLLLQVGEGAVRARHHLNAQLLLALRAFCDDLHTQHFAKIDSNDGVPTTWESLRHWFSPIPPTHTFSHYCDEQGAFVAWVHKPLSEVLPAAYDLEFAAAGPPSDRKEEEVKGAGTPLAIAASIARLPTPVPFSLPPTTRDSKSVPDAVPTLPSSNNVWFDFRLLSTQGKQIFGGGAGFFVWGMAGLAVALTCMGMGIPVPVVAFVAIAVWIVSGVCTMYAGSQMKSSFFPAPPVSLPSPPPMVASPASSPAAGA